jgi:DNA-binding protein HU-beta
MAESRFLNQLGNANMNKAELIEAVATAAELTKAQTSKAIDALLEVITTAITKGESVALIGFGTFKQVLRAAREGRNPATGAKLKIAAAKLAKFSAGASLKAAVAGKKSAAKPKKAAVAKKPGAAKKSAAAKKPVAKKK